MTGTGVSRQTAASENPRDVRPIVAVRNRDMSPWLFASIAIVAAILLFVALDGRRRAGSAPEQGAAVSIGVRPEAVPEFSLPEPSAAVQPGQLSGRWLLPYDRPPPISPRTDAVPVVRPVVVAGPRTAPPVVYAPPYSVAPAVITEPPAALPFPQPAVAGGAEAAGSNDAGRRIRASRLASPSTTVPQGTLVGAVLETALDSTGPGQVRAMVTRDVFGFDGTRLLIPRGTKLYGTYDSAIAEGEKRAQIRWTRLLRPDAVTIALDSPASDPLGRAGIAGRVNSHFLQKLGNALLSSTVNLGSALVSRRVSPVTVAVTGGPQQGAAVVPQSQGQIRPTLTVRQGTSISVFVQNDLDFSDVEGAQ